MKKISTLALALIAMGSLSMPASAQVNFVPVSTSTLESGWYQMRQVVGKSISTISTTAPRYVYSSNVLGGASYTYFGTAAEQKTDATAFVYVDNNGTDQAIMAINGKWGSRVAKYTANNNRPIGAKGDDQAYTIKQDASDNTLYIVGTYWDDWKGWNYMGGSTNAAYNVTRFQFSKVSDETLKTYDIYKYSGVESASCTLETNKGTQTVYDGGSFFFTAGTTINESDIVTPDKDGYKKTTTINATDKTISVTYVYDESAFTVLLQEAEAVLASKRIGYPIESSEAYKNFSSAVATAKSVTKSTVSDYTTLKAAVSAFKLSSDNIRMPEDGKAYTITAVSKAGVKSYMNYAASGYTLKKTDAADNSSYDETAKFVCHKVEEGKYVFVNNDGKFLTYKGLRNAAVNDNKGYTDGYVNIEYTVGTTAVSFNPQIFTLTKVTAAGVADAYMNLQSKRGNIDKGNYAAPNDVYYTIENSTAYNAYSSQLLNDTYSTAFLFEETTYPNTVTFNAVSDVEGVNNLATFSAPFATVIPEGVTAYYVSTADNSKATMKAIEAGKAIPANEGVILTSESGTAVTMVPATDETLATIENNKLGNSAGAAKTIAEGDNAYILAGGANGTAFYKGTVGTTLKANKAYLTLNVAGGEQAISMNFGGNVTGINQIVNAEQNNAPVYDLTGRRVVRTVKGGLYIKGGNKFIAR
jgi:hypothetical protein